MEVEDVMKVEMENMKVEGEVVVVEKEVMEVEEVLGSRRRFRK